MEPQYYVVWAALKGTDLEFGKWKMGGWFSWFIPILQSCFSLVVLSNVYGDPTLSTHDTGSKKPPTNFQWHQLASSFVHLWQMQLHFTLLLVDNTTTLTPPSTHNTVADGGMHKNEEKHGAWASIPTPSAPCPNLPQLSLSFAHAESHCISFTLAISGSGDWFY